MIGPDDVNAAFDRLVDAFNQLAKIEDRQTELVTSIGEYKEGNRKAQALKNKLQDLQPKLVDAQRAYRLAAMEADRVRLLVAVVNTAMGRD